MNWIKREIKLEDIPAIAKQGMAMAKAGNPIVEQLRCVYQLENDPVIYMIPLLDYIDAVPDQKFISFQLCQMAE